MQQPARRRSPGAGGWAAAAATVDEASMERSKSFIKALQVRPSITHTHCRSVWFGSWHILTVVCVQELKNLRPQLYSASEYCEKSYLHAQQKQM
jgi:hypothetical protein